jgi:Secretion system C-terminal sorting domain/Beta-lactamase
MIAETAAGKNVAQWIREVVITPAGLNNTFFPPYETVTSTRAHVWTNFGNGYLQYQDLPVEFYSLADAAGGMLSDAADNNKFWISLFNGDIIQKSTLINEMMNWKVASSSLSYGLGLAKQMYYGNETYSHGGSILGQLNENLTDTVNGITISVLTNQDSVTNVHALIGLYKILLQQHKVGLTSLSNTRDLIYPNPATSVVNVRAASPVKTAAVYDVTGRAVWSSSINSSAFEFDVSELPAGIYILKLQDGNGERVRKFVKE